MSVVGNHSSHLLKSPHNVLSGQCFVRTEVSFRKITVKDFLSIVTLPFSLSGERVRFI